MNPQVQTQALAELDGLEVRLEYGPQFKGSLFHEREIWTIHRHKDLPHDWIIWEPKPYLTSYDAIIPLIQRQNFEIKTLIGVYLCKIHFLTNVDNETILPKSWETIVSDFICATPSQLCEALLRATGKWKD